MKFRILFLTLFISLALQGCGWFKKQSTRPETPVVMGISYMGISVKDLNSAISLYSESAGLTLIKKASLLDNEVINQLSQGLSQEQPSRVETALVRGVNGQIRFMQFNENDKVLEQHSPVPVNGTGIAHVCFQVNQTTQTYKTFLDNGATHLGEKELVQISSRNPVYYGYAHDPEGILIEVEEVDVSALELESPPKNDYRLRQISLATPDMDRILSFYSTLLQEDNPRRIGKWINLSGDKIDAISGLPESEIEMAWFQTRNLEIEIVQYHSHPPENDTAVRPLNAHGYNLIMFEVSDLDSIKSMLRQAGSDIVFEHPNFDGLPTLFTRDPDGNLLGFQPSDINNPLSAAQFLSNGL